MVVFENRCDLLSQLCHFVRCPPLVRHAQQGRRSGRRAVLAAYGVHPVTLEHGLHPCPAGSAGRRARRRGGARHVPQVKTSLGLSTRSVKRATSNAAGSLTQSAGFLRET